MHEARTHIATTLQRSLLPPRLPVVPGLSDRRALPRRGRRRARSAATSTTSSRAGERLDGRDGRRHRQGPGRRGDHVAGALHDAHRRALRATARSASCARLNAVARRRPPTAAQICTAVCAAHRPRGPAASTSLLAMRRPSAAAASSTADRRGARGRRHPGTLLGAFREGRWTAEDVRLAPGDSARALHRRRHRHPRRRRALRPRAARGAAAARSGPPTPTTSPRASTRRCTPSRTGRSATTSRCSSSPPSTTDRRRQRYPD